MPFSTAPENLRSFRLQVDGMTDEAAGAAVQKALENIDGVLVAKVSLEAGIVAVTLEQSADASELVPAVERAGYDARPEPSPSTTGG